MLIKKNKLSIYDVESLHKKFLNELSKDTITIDMKNVNKIDATIIQLFISLQKSAKAVSKEFLLQNVNDEVKDILKGYFCDSLLLKGKDE